jgi:hypothetical protein
MLSALAADAAAHVRGGGAMLELLPTSCRQCGLQLLRPFLVGFSESPHLIGSQAKITQYLPERLAAVDRNEKLLTHLGRESLLRLAAESGLGGVVWAWRHRSQSQPSSQRVRVPWGT